MKICCQVRGDEDWDEMFHLVGQMLRYEPSKVNLLIQ